MRRTRTPTTRCCTARGSITFVLEDSGERLELRPGDRLDIPPGVVHSALVGREGVACVEAPRPV
jgi:quercetin dioxygenase-like cupin family protein